MCLLEQHGFRAVTLEGIAEAAGVARTTVYRRWPNKAAVVMDAFLTHVAPRIAFPEHPVAVERLRLQMQLLARAFQQGPGLLLRALSGRSAGRSTDRGGRKRLCDLADG